LWLWHYLYTSIWKHQINLFTYNLRASIHLQTSLKLSTYSDWWYIYPPSVQLQDIEGKASLTNPKKVSWKFSKSFSYHNNDSFPYYIKSQLKVVPSPTLFQSFFIEISTKQISFSAFNPCFPIQNPYFHPQSHFSSSKHHFYIELSRYSDSPSKITLGFTFQTLVSSSVFIFIFHYESKFDRNNENIDFNISHQNIKIHCLV
jgi:hypothetical protein